jgi:hypothetical protein
MPKAKIVLKIKAVFPYSMSRIVSGAEMEISPAKSSLFLHVLVGYVTHYSLCIFMVAALVEN